MMVKIGCGCGHVGVVLAESLPRSMVCSACGDVSLVEKGERIRNAAFFTEWLIGSGNEELVDTGAP